MSAPKTREKRSLSCARREKRMMGTQMITSARFTATALSKKATVMTTHVTGAAPTAKRHPSPTGRMMRSPRSDIPRKWASFAHMTVVAEMGSVR